MFEVITVRDAEDKVTGVTINLSRGDTGAIKFSCPAVYRGTDTPYEWQSEDRAVFTIKTSGGSVIKEKVSEIEDDEFVVVFYNQDTDTLAGGVYSWDVRYVIQPYYDETGKIVNGAQVITPLRPQTLNLITTVGDI